MSGIPCAIDHNSALRERSPLTIRLAPTLVTFIRRRLQNTLRTRSFPKTADQPLTLPTAPEQRFFDGFEVALVAVDQRQRKNFRERT
jgi:hypothetical protein